MQKYDTSYLDLMPLDFHEWNFCWRFWWLGKSACCNGSVDFSNGVLSCLFCGHQLILQDIVTVKPDLAYLRSLNLHSS